MTITKQEEVLSAGKINNLSDFGEASETVITNKIDELIADG